MRSGAVPKKKAKFRASVWLSRWGRSVMSCHLEVGLPVADRGRRHQLVQGREVGRLADDEAALAREAGLAEIGVPVNGGGEAP